jgi:hypothetical protein
MFNLFIESSPITCSFESCFCVFNVSNAPPYITQDCNGEQKKLDKFYS